MASRQKRTRSQVRDHELEHLQKLQSAGIGRMKNDSDVQAALGRYMRSYDFKAGVGAHCVEMAHRSGLGGGFHGILLGYAVASFRLMDKKHGNEFACRDSIEREVIPRFLHKYPKVDQGVFQKAMRDLADDIIRVGQSVLSATENAQETTNQT